jgi:hypothetical protein
MKVTGEMIMGSPHQLHHVKPRGHKAFPVPPQHLPPPPPPPAPPALTASQYLLAIMGKTNSAIANWRAFGAAVDKAYCDAYKHMLAVLSEVKEVQEARRKEKEAAFNFALNILTIGIGGGLATAAEKYVVGRIGKEAAKTMEEEGVKLVEKFAGSISDKVGDKLVDQGKEAAEWAYKFGQPSLNEAFKPPGVDPTEFGATIRDSIESRAADLESTVAALTDPVSQQSMPVELAKFWYELILQFPFVREAPAKIDWRMILPNSSAALWIAWAWGRDTDYWRRQAELDIMRNVTEEIDFDPIRRALDACRIPAAVINKSADHTLLNPMAMDKHTRKEVEEMIEQQKVEDVRDLHLIDMDKFITWSNTSAVTEVLFSGLHHAKSLPWFEEVGKQIAKRQRFGAMAEYMPDV